MDERIIQYDDTYPSGAPVDQIVFDAGRSDAVPIVKWSLPNGDRLTSTLPDYNRNFRFIWIHEEQWRNAANLRKRERAGLTPAEHQELADFAATREAFFRKITLGEQDHT